MDKKNFERCKIIIDRLRVIDKLYKIINNLVANNKSSDVEYEIIPKEGTSRKSTGIRIKQKTHQIEILNFIKDRT